MSSESSGDRPPGRPSTKPPLPRRSQRPPGAAGASTPPPAASTDTGGAHGSEDGTKRKSVSGFRAIILKGQADSETGGPRVHKPSMLPKPVTTDTSATAPADATEQL